MAELLIGVAFPVDLSSSTIKCTGPQGRKIHITAGTYHGAFLLAPLTTTGQSFALFHSWVGEAHFQRRWDQYWTEVCKTHGILLQTFTRLLTSACASVVATAHCRYACIKAKGKRGNLQKASDATVRTSANVTIECANALSAHARGVNGRASFLSPHQVAGWRGQ